MSRTKLLSIIGLILIAGGVGAFIYRDIHKGVSESSEINIHTTGGTENEGAKTEVISNTLEVAAPVLERSMDFKNTLTPEAKVLITEKLNKTIADLKKDGKNYQNWIMLGVYRKTLGDYEGARDAWEYAKTLSPGDVVAYNNLGDLYHYFLKDFAKSEKNWKQTIVVKPDYIIGYNGLVELYKYSLTVKYGEVPALLKGGMTKNPDSVDLPVMLAHYYQDTGDKALARTAYEQAIAAAKRTGNTTAEAALEQEMSALK